MFTHIDHIVIDSDDIDRTSKFYETIGFKKEVFDGNRISLHSGNFKINLHETDTKIAPKSKSSKIGNVDICIITDSDIEELRKDFIEKNIAVFTEIVTRTGARGKVLSFYLYDDLGNLIEISKYK